MRASNKKFTSPNLHIIGDNNTITGPNCTVTGDNNKLTGPNCTAHGDNNKLTGPNCTAHGDNNTLVGPNCKAHGRNNKVTGPSFEGSVIGNVGDDGPVVVNMSAGGGMRIFKNGVEQEPFMVSKDSKKAKSKKRTAVEAEPEIKFIEGPSKADLANDKESGDGEATCIICLTNVPCCIATPCNHMSYCVSCARMLCFTNVEDESPKQVGQQACPKCKKQVEKITRVFN